MAYIYSRNFDKALAPLRLAISLQPRYYFPHAWYGIALGRMQQRDSAIAEARAALLADPNNGMLVDLLSASYQRKLDLLRRTSELSSKI